MNNLSKLREIRASYTHFIIDLWGVVHDGSRLYPGAGEAIQTLAQDGKEIVFLSNAPRRSQRLDVVLRKLGIKREWYSFAMSSGEMAYQDFMNQEKPEIKALGHSYLLIAPERDADLLGELVYSGAFSKFSKKLPEERPVPRSFSVGGFPAEKNKFQKAQSANEAGFILCVGFEDNKYDINLWMPMMKEGLKHNLPMVCVNPDLQVVKQSGETHLCAGLIAREYEKMGGKTIYYGKPHIGIYEKVHELLGRPDKAKMLAIGDSMETDIKGAQGFGIDSALVLGGILKFMHEIDENAPPPGFVERLTRDYGFSPTYALAKLG